MNEQYNKLGVASSEHKPSLEPNAESIASIQEADEIIARKGTGRFRNAQEMFKGLGI